MECRLCPREAHTYVDLWSKGVFSRRLPICVECAIWIRDSLAWIRALGTTEELKP